MKTVHLASAFTHSHSKDIQTFHPPRMSFLRYGSKLMVHGRNFRRSFTFSGVLWLSLLARNASILRGFLSISSSGSISLDTGIFSDILKFFFHTLNLSLKHRFYTQHVFFINTSLLYLGYQHPVYCDALKKNIALRFIFFNTRLLANMLKLET